MSTLAERARAARLHAKFKQAELAKKLGRAQATIHDIEAGKQRTATFLSSWALYCGVDPIWLETGRGEMVSENTAKAPEDYGQRRVQLIAFNNVSEWETEVVKAEVTAPGDCLLVRPDVSKRSFAVMVTDHSMEPDFRIGDLIVVDADVKPRPGDCVVATDAGQPVFRKYRAIRGGDDPVFELAPLNADFAVARSADADITVIGVVVEHRRCLVRYGG